MSRRSSSINRVDSGISREIGRDIEKVRLVADNIQAVITAAGIDLAGLADSIEKATDFEGITVVAGTAASWDPVTKILTVPAVTGEKGDVGEDLRITSITPITGGRLEMLFSDGTLYTTPPLKGDKGATGDKGDKGDSVGITSIVYQGSGAFLWTFTDNTTYLTPDLRGGQGDKGDKGDKGDQGAPLELTNVIPQGDGVMLWQFSDGSTFTSPSLTGPKGDDGDQGSRGPQGVSVHHMKGTSTTDPEGDFNTEGAMDTYTFYGDANEEIVLGWFTIQNGRSSDESRVAAVAAANAAERWATEATDVPVTPGKFSAKHYAEKASDKAVEAGNSLVEIAAHRTAAEAAEAAALAHVDTAADFSTASEASSVSSASSAAASAGSASSSASSAAESEASKTSSNGFAVASAGSAAASASSATASAAALQEFRELYYGESASHPTTDPYGGAIEVGDLYFNSTYSELMVWALVDGSPEWKYAGAGPKGDRGDDFGIDAAGTLAQRAAHDDAPKYFTYYATDQMDASYGEPFEQTFEHDVAGARYPVDTENPSTWDGHSVYTLSQPIGGAKAIMLTMNGAVQSPSSYLVSEPTPGVFTVTVDTEEDDTITVREFAPAFVYGAVFFKLSNDTADWSIAVPFTQGVA